MSDPAAQNVTVSCPWFAPLATGILIGGAIVIAADYFLPSTAELDAADAARARSLPGRRPNPRPERPARAPRRGMIARVEACGC